MVTQNLEARERRHRSLGVFSLRLRLAFGSVVLGGVALLAAGALYFGTVEVGKRLDAAVRAEKRMARYATLSTKVSTFLVVATEAIQTGLPSEQRLDRLSAVVDDIQQTFGILQADLAHAVCEMAQPEINQQARFGTQSLGLARMEALLINAFDGLKDRDAAVPYLRGKLDSFASGFDPLLNQAVNSERIFRAETLKEVETLRARLRMISAGIAVLAIVLVLVFYFGLILPQFRRLDHLRVAAQKLGDEDFDLALPIKGRDEIDEIFAETQRMAQALERRRGVVAREWAALNTTIEQRTAELRAANAKLEEVDENRRRFFADVSHELRTPLTVILMEAQIGQQSPEDSRAAFEVIETRVARLNRRIDDLLRIARSDSGQIVLDQRVVSIKDLVHAVRDEVRAEIDNAGMQLSLVGDMDGTVYCDENWLRQVLVSLIRNTIRHARGGGKVALRVEGQTDQVRFAVCDNGPGIAPQDQDRVFKRFSQASASAAEGFGIGLALVRWVVEAHEGAVAILSPVPRLTALGEADGTGIVITLLQKNGEGA